MIEVIKINHNFDFTADLHDWNPKPIRRSRKVILYMISLALVKSYWCCWCGLRGVWHLRP